MFKNKKKDEKDKKKQNTDELPEDYKTEKEKLIENKMDEIETSLKKYEDKGETDLSSIPRDLSDLQKEIDQEHKQVPINETNKASSQIKSQVSPAIAKFKPIMKDILPVWIEKPFYYVTPAEKFQDRRKLWQKEWADFLFRWANANDKYVIEILALQKEYPFKNPVINKELNIDQLQLIGDYLVENNSGIWKTKNKSHIRIYWEPLEETAEKIYLWAFDRGQKYIGVFDILDSKQIFSELSTEEIYDCLLLLVKNKKGEWADKKKEMVYLLFPV